MLPLNPIAPIRAILFDLDNTLIDRNGALRKHLALWLKKFAPSVQAEQYPMEIAAMMQQDDWGYADHTGFCAWLQKRHEVKLSAEAISTDLHDNLPRQLNPDPLTLSLLGSLKASFTVGLISNGSGKTQRAKIQHTGLDAIFEEQHIFIEGEIGCAKPRPEMFELAINRLSIPPARFLFVGDHPINDMAGAANAGMKTCWVAQGRAFPNALVEPDYVIESITQLSSLFNYA